MKERGKYIFEKRMCFGAILMFFRIFYDKMKNFNVELAEEMFFLKKISLFLFYFPLILLKIEFLIKKFKYFIFGIFIVFSRERDIFTFFFLKKNFQIMNFVCFNLGNSSNFFS